MSLINNNYVFVEEETVKQDAESTTHPVEQGIELTDHVRRVPVVLTLKGKIVNHKKGDGEIRAADILSNLVKLKDCGSLITYIGRCAVYNLQIQSFSTSHPNSIWGGCEFDMELKEVRIAKPAFQQKSNPTKTNVGTQQVKSGENEAVYYTVKAGDCIWNLVVNNYRNLLPRHISSLAKCQWIMQQNPHAFSRAGDFTTLQIGRKILMGYRA